MKLIYHLIIFLCFLQVACTKQVYTDPSKKNVINRSGGELATAKAPPSPPSVVTYLTGDGTDVNTSALGGLVLMGGSTDVDAAIGWFLQRASGGDVVVIRSSGADGYNQYMYNMVTVNSVETIVIDSREKANLASVSDKIRKAEALFIAGGDQWNYVNYWKNTATEDAINYLLNSKNVTVGGTSAGLAILGAAYFSAQNGSITSSQALSDPYNRGVALGSKDFLSAPNMQNTITDSHYTQRDRQGRHITFMARLIKDFSYTTIKGIGIDEETAVCIDANGIGKVYGLNNAYFLKNTGSGAEKCESKKPLTWNLNGTAIQVYRISGTATGNGSFDAANWTFSGASSFNYYVNNGVLIQN